MFDCAALKLASSVESGTTQRRGEEVAEMFEAASALPNKRRNILVCAGATASYLQVRARSLFAWTFGCAIKSIDLNPRIATSFLLQTAETVPDVD